MEVTKNGKALYHIQNMNICTDGTPYDEFVFCDHWPTENDLKELFHNEFGHDEQMLDEFLTSSNIYEVYAEEL